MNWRITINTEDLITVFKKTKVRKSLGKRNIAAELVELDFDGTSLNILVISAKHSIHAQGKGKGRALITLAIYQRLQKAYIASPPRNRSIEISFDADAKKITFGSTTLVAVAQT
jgi:hypothetical protein